MRVLKTGSEAVYKPLFRLVKQRIRNSLQKNQKNLEQIIKSHEKTHDFSLSRALLKLVNGISMELRERPGGKARGPEEGGRAPRAPRPPVPPCSRSLAFPLILPWALWKSLKLA